MAASLFRRSDHLLRRFPLFLAFEKIPHDEAPISRHHHPITLRGLLTRSDGSRWGPLGERLPTRGALGNYDAKKKRNMRRRSPYDPMVMDSEELGITGSDMEQQQQNGDDDDEDSFLTQRRFEEYNISSLTIKALTSAGYDQMTGVQEAALPACLDGKDVIVKAKSGTGKSMTFLLPTIEAVLKVKGSSQSMDQSTAILALILCPTRELASQIAAETNVLLKYHEGLTIQTLVGGTRFKVDQQLLEYNPPQIIVATPGRLLDHIENRVGFSLRLMGLKILVIDEADHLLDLGFRNDVEKIVDCLPRQRQTLLFSAAIPKEVRRISQLVLRRDHVFIDTVGLQSSETSSKVLQWCLVAPHENHLEIIYQLLNDHIAEEVEYKVIIFCTTAMVTSLVYTFLKNMKMNVREIHSYKPQLYRTRISCDFKDSKQLILVTSEVSARGMNYPDVTLVVQVGLPFNRGQYIHRLGRTGRKGKVGEGILLLAPWEEYFMDEIKDLPIERSSLPELHPDVREKVQSSLKDIDMGIKEAAYHAWLGYYNSIRAIGREKTTLVELANRFAASIGLENPPKLARRTALKMGLLGIPGIRIKT